MNGGAQYRITARELQEYGAKWHEQGARSAEMAGGMATLNPENADAAATLSLSSAIESLVGNIFVASSAICERLEALTQAVYFVGGEIHDHEDSGQARARRLKAAGKPGEDPQEGT
jgi:hypothetical protein